MFALRKALVSASNYHFLKATSKIKKRFFTLTLHPNPVKPYFKNPDECLSLCDLNDNEIGFMLRRLKVKEPVINRCSSVIIMTPNSSFYVQKRKLTKSWCPGYWDLSFGGLVRYGESYLENAMREIEEELNIENVNLDPIFKFLLEDEASNSKTWCQVFIGVYKGNIKAQYEEVECVSLMTKDEILSRMKAGEKFSPDGKMAWEGVMKMFGIKIN